MHVERVRRTLGFTCTCPLPAPSCSFVVAPGQGSAAARPCRWARPSWVLYRPTPPWIFTRCCLEIQWPAAEFARATASRPPVLCAGGHAGQPGARMRRGDGWGMCSPSDTRTQRVPLADSPSQFPSLRDGACDEAIRPPRQMKARHPISFGGNWHDRRPYRLAARRCPGARARAARGEVRGGQPCRKEASRPSAPSARVWTRCTPSGRRGFPLVGGEIAETSLCRELSSARDKRSQNACLAVLAVQATVASLSDTPRAILPCRGSRHDASARGVKLGTRMIDMQVAGKGVLAWSTLFLRLRCLLTFQPHILLAAFSNGQCDQKRPAPRSVHLNVGRHRSCITQKCRRASVIVAQ